MDISHHPDVSAALAKLEDLLDTTATQKQIPGMAAALIFDQQIAWSKSWGCADLEAGIPAGLQTAFDAGSIVKILTDTMLMQLRDAGKLQLDDPIERYLPEFHLNSRHGEPPPTFRQVAGHIAGIPREPGYSLDERGAIVLPAMDEVLTRVQAMDFVYPPMSGMHYSNLGVYVLGHALARIAGQPYREYVHEHILTPLGMVHSAWESESGPAAAEAAQYRAKKYVPKYEDYPHRPAGQMNFGETGAPGGGFSTSVADLARFVMFQFHDGTDAREAVLSRHSLAEMRLPVWSEPWGGTGIGWFMSHSADHKVIHHGGSGPGCSAAMRLCPDLKVGFVVMYNEMNFMENALAQQALEITIPAVAKALAAQNPPAPLPPLPPDAANCAGRYETAGEAWRLTLRLAEGSLNAVLGYAGQDLLGFDLVQAGGEDYTIRGSSFDGEKVGFEHGPSGSFSRLMMWGLPFDRVNPE